MQNLNCTRHFLYLNLVPIFSWRCRGNQRLFISSLQQFQLLGLRGLLWSLLLYIQINQILCLCCIVIGSRTVFTLTSPSPSTIWIIWCFTYCLVAINWTRSDWGSTAILMSFNMGILSYSLLLLLLNNRDRVWSWSCSWLSYTILLSESNVSDRLTPCWKFLFLLFYNRNDGSQNL